MTKQEFLDMLIQEQDLVQGYIGNLIKMFSLDEPFLYQQGFFDGIRTMKFLFHL